MQAFYAKLTRNITAEDLAMDAPDGDGGYPAEFVIGPAGSMVKVVSRNDQWAMVEDFLNDTLAYGYVRHSDIA